MISTGLAYFVIFIVVILPYIVYRIINVSKVPRKKYRARYSGLFSLYQEESGSKAGFDVKFLLRKLVFALALVFLQEQPVVQFGVIAVNNVVLFVWFVCVKPYQSSTRNRLKQWSEALFSLGTLIMILFPVSSSYKIDLPYSLLGWLTVAFLLISLYLEAFAMLCKDEVLLGFQKQQWRREMLIQHAQVLLEKKKKLQEKEEEKQQKLKQKELKKQEKLKVREVKRRAEYEKKKAEQRKKEQQRKKKQKLQ